MTADTLTATANSAYTSNPWSATGAASYINSVYVRRRTGVGQIFIYNPAVSAASPIAVTSEWTRFSGPTSATSGSFVIQLQTSGDQIDIWGAQGEAGSTATPYQKVTTQYDVTEAGVPSCSYLFFDGGSDSMSTSTITPGTDKAQVFAGVRKLVDSPSGAVIEFGNLAADNGGFAVHAPNTAVGLQYRWSLRNNAGTVTDLGPVAGYAAPITNVLTGIGDISGDLSTIRINSAQVATSAADQGTGNFNSYALTVGARVGGSLYFNGNLFGLITRFGANLTTQQITSTEQWLAPKSTFFAPVITGVPTVGVS
jgi:hypothetical protein